MNTKQAILTILICTAITFSFLTINHIHFGLGTGSSMPYTPYDLFIEQGNPDTSNLTGKVVIYKLNETTLIMHRVIWENATHFIAKGDCNSIADPIMPKQNITYILILRIPYGIILYAIIIVAVALWTII